MPSRILVVDDMSLSRIILRARLSSACYQTILAPTGQDALDLARRHLPDLVLMDCVLPDLNGPDVCKALRADPLTAHIPIILFSAESVQETRLAALTAGADDFLPKPIDESYLLSRLRALLRRGAIGEVLRQHMTPALRAHLATVTCAPCPSSNVTLVTAQTDKIDAAGSDAQAMCQTTMDLPSLLALGPTDGLPDILLLAPDLIRLHGINIISELQSRPLTRHIPIIALLPETLKNMRTMALDLGAEDILSLPIHLPEARLRLTMVMARKIRSDAMLKALDVELRMASRDSLTGLFNRRHAISRLSEMIRGTGADRITEFALLLIDLDNFKRVNDTFGHLAGDDVLREVSRRMRAALRPDDLLARIGGEEFLLALPNVSADVAHQMAERIRRQIEGTDYRVKQGQKSLRMTASIGVTMHKSSEHVQAIPAARHIDTLIEQTDQALRLAKTTGRNRVSIGISAVA